MQKGRTSNNGGERDEVTSRDDSTELVEVREGAVVTREGGRDKGTK
jgi:hypothetical protein